ncbi:MAG TPA: hypothetical protein VGS97_20145 [Actinocrinis sp.]|uniref:hypothetical protein n=1 Tax=Actinocrinis sp. TaxID=1920516 RepID=UPI002DDDB867|nr:hypothetical protein [Actinocrinis sp.]HEV2346421.1 hypothetical protein [Actinocrinis sp.]
MAKGKYAARAATTRAENATEKAARLEAALAAERAAHAAVAAELKSQIQQLQGQLTRGLTELAGGAVAAAHRDARELVEAERAQRDAQALEAYKLMLDVMPGLEHEDALRICELLGIHPGEGIRHYDITNRGARRMSGKRMRHALDRYEQGAAPVFNMPKKRA